jgi:cytochrome P450
LTLGSGVTVPARSILVVPLHLVQMDASVWGDDADQFNPHRFLKRDIDLGGLLSLPILFTLHSVGRNFIYGMKLYY